MPPTAASTSTMPMIDPALDRAGGSAARADGGGPAGCVAGAGVFADGGATTGRSAVTGIAIVGAVAAGAWLREMTRGSSAPIGELSATIGSSSSSSAAAALPAPLPDDGIVGASRIIVGAFGAARTGASSASPASKKPSSRSFLAYSSRSDADGAMPRRSRAHDATSSNGRRPSMRSAISHSKSYMRMRAPDFGSLTSKYLMPPSSAGVACRSNRIRGVLVIVVPSRLA